jgi:hypothetical protein
MFYLEGSNPERMAMFTSRHALFYPFNINVDSAFRAMEDDFGLLPMPKRNVQQKTYFSGVNHNAPVLGIIITNRQLRETGIIMEAMAARFAPLVEMQKADQRNFLRSDDDVEMMDKYILPNEMYDIAHILQRTTPANEGFLAVQSQLSAYLIARNLSDFASAIEAQRMAMEHLVNEVVFP